MAAAPSWTVRRSSGLTPKEIKMPTMSDSRRKKIQARQRKAENAKKREEKIVKKERNKEKA